MWIVKIAPRSKKQKPRTVFARTEHQLTRALASAPKLAKVQVYEDRAPLIAELYARERNGLCGKIA
jgi:hypothetical protein